jgi:NadR type nicotinamide-nucleotide adenylyltransferase
MTPRHGLVIGKFYPPHAGHHLLVGTAAACCERVTVVVMAASVESIPLETRVQWMREAHPGPGVAVVGTVDDHPVDFESDAVWSAHVALMREAAARVTPLAVDAVFTSEPYGAELARRLGARHVGLDLARGLVPISASRVRADPVGSWEHLSEPVRAWFARRVVVLGAESTGKTTLAAELAHRLRQRGAAFGATRWVAEHGRDYTVALWARTRAQAQLDGLSPPALEGLSWPSSAFDDIARAQNRLEDSAARAGGPVLVCDTDAFATGVWHERYLGHRSPAVEALARRHDLYLLTHPADVPFTQDGLRDGESIRAWMTEVFAARLEATGRRWAWLRGSRAERVEAALAAVDVLLAAGWGLAAPLG